MAVAGIGVGFCGVQLTSDQTTIHGEGSANMGESCNDRTTLDGTVTDSLHFGPASTTDGVGDFELLAP